MQDGVGRGEDGSAGERRCRMRCRMSGGEERKDDGGFAGT